MKTIREWLEELPEPYRSEAIENTQREDERDGIKRRNNVDTFGVNQDNIYNALSSAFVWDDSPQGFEYWSTFSSQLPQTPTTPL